MGLLALFYMHQFSFPGKRWLIERGDPLWRAPINSTERPSGSLTRDLLIINHKLAVDEYIIDPVGVLAWRVIGRRISNRVWIEDHYVGGETGPQDTAIQASDPARGGGGHL